MAVGPWQLLIILLIVVMIFGTKKLRNIGGELHRTGREERNTLMNQTLKALGYTGSAAAEIRETIQTIYSTTQDWGGHHGGRGPRPPR